MESLPPNTKLIFLVGAPRSGTTWLQMLLSGSPLIATCAETHLFSVYTPSLFSGWSLSYNAQADVGLHHLMSEAEYLDLVRELASKVMARILATKPGATIALEKTPRHALHWRNILAIFPEAHFIHIVRDPRSVVASARAAGRSWGSHWAPRGVAEACSFWLAHVKAAREIAGATKNYLEVRYGDLKEDGPHTLQSTFAWCGIETSSSEAAEILQKYDFEQLQSRQVDRKLVPLGSVPDGFFRKGEIDSWKSDLTAREIYLVEHMTGDLMAELGYSPAMQARRAWRSPGILPTLALERLRSGLGWRLRRFGEALSPLG